MKIQYCSDLHLEFKENKNFLAQNPIQPSGEILILAGDIVPFAMLHQFSDFIDFVSRNFEMVYWLPGNHEYYHFDLRHVKNSLYKKICSNVICLNNQVISCKNVNLIFSTLWSPISPQNEWQVRQSISDYSMIKKHGKHTTPADINTLHQTDFNFLTSALNTDSDKTNIVITHHVPTFFNYPEKYKDSKINQAFAVELYDFIFYANPAYWIYGHHHHNTPEFKIGKTTMLTNQLGYVRQNEHEQFKTNAVIKIK